jgi:hypothetical protein
LQPRSLRGQLPTDGHGSGAGSSAESAGLSYTLQVSAVTPEPSSLTLLILGTFGLAGWGWRLRSESATT